MLSSNRHKSTTTSHILTIGIKRVLLVLTLLYGFFFPANAQTVTNGSFTDITGNSITPSGWNNVLGYNPGTSLGVSPSVDVLDINFTAYFNNAAVAVSPSPDGGTWTGLSSIPPDFENEAIEQVVPGFVIGQQYQLSFYAANFGGTPFIDPGVVTAYVDGIAVASSPTLNLVANVWTTVTGTFTATATSMTVQIDVIHNTGDTGAGGYFSVDGLTIVPLANPCNAGNTPPALSQTTACLPSGTFDLTTITSSNTPAGTTMNWYSGTPASLANEIASPGSVTIGTYYAAFYDAVNDCFSPTTPVNINPEPVAAFNAPDVCEGGTTVFTDQSTISSGTITGWNWDFGDGGTSTLQNPTHIYSGTPPYSVTLTVTSGAGCTNNIVQQVSTIVAPAASFTFVASCANNPVTFTDQSTVASGTITGWSWNFGDGNTSSAQNPTHQYASASNYSVTLTVTSDLGCTSSQTQQVSTTAPTAAFSAPAVCNGATTVFTDQSTISAGVISTWSWDFGDGGTSALQNPTHVYGNSGNYTVSLTVTSDQGCTNTLTQQVTVNTLPTAAFSAPVACSNFPVVFTDQSTITSGNISGWNWNFGDGTSSTSQNPSHQYGSTVGNNYSVTLTVTSNLGCTNAVTQQVTTITAPNASFTYAPIQPDIINPLVQFANNSSGALIYSWNFDNLGSSTQQNPSFTFPETAGNHTIQLIAYNGSCTDTAYATINVKDVLIYYVPNCFTPDGDEFNQLFYPVFYNGFDPYDFNLQIFNRWGEVVFESNDAQAGWDGTYHGKIVQDGMYTWRIEFKTLATDERIIDSGHLNILH